MKDEAIADHVVQRAASKSIVQSFEIHGLYGYRSISIESEYAASIVIARNGSGKTTLLGAMDAFLRGHFTRLRDIPFKTIVCKLRDLEYPLVLKSTDLHDFLDSTNNVEFLRLLRQLKFDRWAVFRFIVEDYEKIRGTYSRFQEDDVYTAIFRLYDSNPQTVVTAIDSIRKTIISKNTAVRKLVETLSAILSGYEIVYLPTYRRIELPLVADAEDRRGRSYQKPNFKFGGSSLFAGSIEFGLTDISERLENINGSISFESSYKYREVSANIITELIEDESKVNDVEVSELPTKAELDLFFSRIKNDRYIGPYRQGETPNVDKLYVENKASNVGGFLRYYLSKLDPIIKSTRDVEASVDQFIDICNTYLLADDESVKLKDAAGRPLPNYDAKELVLDKSNYSVKVESVSLKETMSIDYLSSGEKQMISLFARIYLYPKNKIVLIDEPELSLSLDWQRKILVDVLKAPQCSQVIAITHSPFVFDNVLDAFASPLKITFELNKNRN